MKRTNNRKMKVALVARSTLFSTKGGDTIQIIETARQLEKLGVDAEIRLTTDRIEYNKYDLFHFFNLTRPADILYHLKKIRKPVVLSPVFIDYSKSEQINRGILGSLLSFLSPFQIDYLKTIGRFITRRDVIRSTEFLWKGQFKSIQSVLNRTQLLLPASLKEHSDLKARFRHLPGFHIAPLGIDNELFIPGEGLERDRSTILCVARIERIKNQLNLIKAMNNTGYRLLLVGAPAPNHLDYYAQCRKIAGKNIFFYDQVPQDQLIAFYRAAKVHVLPSWFENCGLSSLEAGAMGCSLVVTEKGYISEYIGQAAFYCDPASPESIFNAIESASRSQFNLPLQKKITEDYTWFKTAERTAEAYQKAVVL